MKIKKLKLKKNNNNEYSDYYYFIPKNENIKCADGSSLESTIYNLKSRIDTLTNKIDDLIKSAPLVGTAKGTNLDIKDSAESRIKRFSIYGNSKQETRSGKNLLYLADEKETPNGLTIETISGAIHITGTTTSSFQGYYHPLNLTYDFDCTLGTTITGKMDGVHFKAKYNGIYPDINNYSIKIEAGKTLEQIYLIIENGKTVDCWIYPQLEKGTTKTDWEPYGVMPSPDYPSEVESCGDNINLIDNISTSGTLNGISYTTNNDGSIILNGTSAGNGGDLILTQNMILQPGIYTISITNKQKFGVWIVGDSGIIASISVDDTNTSTTFELKETTTFKDIHIGFAYYVVSYDNLRVAVKLEKGSKATSYTPYNQGCINEVISNKNLFNKNTVIDGQYYNAYGGLVTSAEASGSDFIKVEVGQNYYVNKTISMVYFDENKQAVGILTKVFTGKFTPKYPYIKVNVYTADKDTLQIEKGSISTACIQHKSQTYTIPVQKPLRSTGDTRDTFIKKDGKWYERHYIYRKIFDGTESFTKETRNEATNFYMTLEGIGSQKGYCNILPVVNNSNYIPNILFIWNNLNGFSMMFDASRFDTLSDYKSYLKSLYDAGTPIYLDYVLKEPLDIECTEEQSQILDNLTQLQTYENITHIYSPDKIEPNMKIAYKKDINSIIRESGV